MPVPAAILPLAGCSGPGDRTAGGVPSAFVGEQDAQGCKRHARQGRGHELFRSVRPAGPRPRSLAEIPDNAWQVVVTGKNNNSPESQMVLYRRTGNGWAVGQTWAAHNVLRDWTDDHHAGDLHSPIGGFTLSVMRADYSPTRARSCPTTGPVPSSPAARDSRASRPSAPSTTWSQSSTAGRAPHRSTRPVRSVRNAMATSGCTSTTAEAPTAA